MLRSGWAISCLGWGRGRGGREGHRRCQEMCEGLVDRRFLPFHARFLKWSQLRSGLFDDAYYSLEVFFVNFNLPHDQRQPCWQYVIAPLLQGGYSARLTVSDGSCAAACRTIMLVRDLSVIFKMGRRCSVYVAFYDFLWTFLSFSQTFLYTCSCTCATMYNTSQPPPP